MKRVLLVYKKSARHVPAIGFQKGRRVPSVGSEFIHRDLERIRRAHRAHLRTLEEVLREIRRRHLAVKMAYRVSAHDLASYDLVISVGGDGTFLEAARAVRSQQVLGVNSDPDRSVGSFCGADGRTFAKVLDRVLAGRVRATPLPRAMLEINGKGEGIHFLNDLLITHRRPAAMSRYWVQIGTEKEEHRSSGLWISTAAGSTGAIQSAGGRRMPVASRALQYRPRELYHGVQSRYRLTGGIVACGKKILVGSLMQDGMICIDGEHQALPFRYGDFLRVVPSPYPLNWIA